MKANLIGISLLGLQGDLIDNSGATYRTNQTMGHFGMACQYWQPPALTYLHPGESVYLTGVGSYWWRDSRECGRCLLVNSGAKYVSLVVSDYCPECSPRQLDINDNAVRLLSSKGQLQNFQKLTVMKVKCHWQDKPYFYLDKGSSVYNWYLIPLNFPQPLVRVTVLEQEAQHDKYGRWAIGFKGKFPTKETFARAYDTEENYLLIKIILQGYP